MNNIQWLEYCAAFFQLKQGKVYNEVKCWLHQIIQVCCDLELHQKALKPICWPFERPFSRLNIWTLNRGNYNGYQNSDMLWLKTKHFKQKFNHSSSFIRGKRSKRLLERSTSEIWIVRAISSSTLYLCYIGWSND